MKKHKISRLLLLFPLLLLSSCINDRVNEVGERSLTLRFSVPQYTTEAPLRASASSDDENIIRSAYVLIFGQNGRRLTTYPIKVNIGGNGSASVTYTASNLTEGRVFVFVLANCAETDAGESDEESLAYPYETPSESFWESIGDINGLKSARISLLANTISRAHSLVASRGEWYDLQVGNNNLNMQLDRLDAKIQFNIQGDPNNPELSFTPERWRLVNVPKHKIPFYVDPSSFPSDSYRTSTDYYRADDCAWRAFETSEAFPGATFTAYCPENRQMPREIIDPAKYKACTGRDCLPNEYNKMYSLRPYHVKTPAPGAENWRVENGDFRFAPGDATYVEFTGVLKQNMGGDIKREANVRYTVLLGFAQERGEGKTNDYFNLRNHHYTYTVTVRGANDIVTEVKDNNLGQNANVGNAGAKGDVTDIRWRHVLDAHYGTFVLYVEKDKIEDPDQIFDYAFSTPYEKQGKRDYKWIRFIRNEKAGMSYSSGLRPRGTEQGIDIEELRNEVKVNYHNPYYWDSNNRITYSAYVNEFYYEQAPTDRNNVLLTTQYRNEWAGEGWRTFVDQPDRTLSIWYKIKPQISADGQSSYSHPDIFITQRSIKCVYDPASVPHGVTTWGFETIDEYPETHHSFFPNLIGGAFPTIIYNPKAISGLGEYTTGRLLNGYDMMLYGYGFKAGDGSFISKPWGDYRVIDDDHYQTRPGTISASAQYQCLVRNADLSGDGNIDQDEVRWYLPAQAQLLSMHILSESLRPQDRLVDPKLNYTTDTYKSLFLTSTMPGSNDLSIVFAIEGSSTGLTSDPTKNNASYLGAGRLSVRCLRALGGSPAASGNYYTAIKIKPTRGVQWRLGEGDTWKDGEGSNYSFIDIEDKVRDVGLYADLRRVDPIALRKDFIARGDLPRHTRLDPWNNPYKAFRIAMIVPRDRYYDTGAFGNEVPLLKLLNDNYCARYQEKDANGSIIRNWRMPAEKELAIMLNYVPWAGVYHTRGWQYGAFNLFYRHITNTYYDATYQHIYVASDTNNYLNYIHLVPANERAKITVRCVKDWNGSIPD